MKLYLYTFFSILLLFVLSFVMANYTLPSNEVEKLAELKNYVRIIESISPADTSYLDLRLLRETLKNRDIIMLGEQTHSDGATFLAKSRLVKFLHQELGFDVLVYETGLYDTENLWKSLKINSADKPVDFSKALYPFWCKNQENEELLNYIQKNIGTEKEMEIAGLDVQFSGRVKTHERDSLLTNYLNCKPQIKATSFPAFISIKNKYSSYTNKWAVKRFSDERKDSIINDIQSIYNVIESIPTKNHEDSLYSRFFRNLETLYSYSWKYDRGENIRFQMRDSAMADNFIWLKENKFRNRKIIVWAANLHTSYDNNSYSPVPIKFMSMGEYLKKKYGEKCYSINFTSFSDANNLTESDKLYSNKSAEYILHQLNKPYLYFDFNEINSTSFMKNEIVMNCNQRMSFNAKWYKITDGIFFIDKMTGLHKLEE